MAAILVAGSEQAKIIRQQQGHEAGLKYLQSVMREVLEMRDPARVAAQYRLIEKQQQEER